MSYKSLVKAVNKDTPHLGGNVKVGDPHTYCPSVWDYVISRFGVDSVLDLGSGVGNSSHYFYRRGLKVVAVEGLSENVETSLYPAVRHDLVNGPIDTRVDLVHCHEVVEHIDEQYLENLLRSLLTGKLILMTHALPGQSGYHHVNLQSSEYWIDHMERVGCTLLEDDTARIRKLAERDSAIYMAATGMIFVNNSRI